MAHSSNHEYTARRRNLLRNRCKERQIDGYLTFDFPDVFYLTGFPSEGCFMLVSQAGDYLFSPQLLFEHAREALKGCRGLRVISQRSLLDALEGILKKQCLHKIGFDSSKVTVSLHRSLAAMVDVQWEAADAFVLEQRSLKDAAEIALISKACHITYQSATECLKKLRAGETEQQLGRRVEDGFRDRGAIKLGFETIVAFGENAAFPHHVVTKKKLPKNSAVLIDCGCAIEGYRSDLTRTGHFGKISMKFRKVYEIVRHAQEAGIAAVRDGVAAGDIDAVCREIIEKSGYGDFFVHGTGHGVGIDIHEPPRLGPRSKEILREGMVVTVEPGIYLPGEFGVRIENTMLVQKNGCKILTR